MVWENLPNWALGPARLLGSLLAAYVLGAFAVKPLVSRFTGHTAVSRPLSRISFYLTVLAGLFVGLNLAGYGQAIGVLGAVVAAGTFAFGFAMKDTISAFVAGFFIFVDKPFQIGDWIEWDGNEGKVQDIHLRTTKVRTFDNELLTVPNDQIANAIVKNHTANDRLRMKTTIGIGYEDDIDAAKEHVREVLENSEEVRDSPEPEVTLTELGDSTVNIQAFYWIDNPKKARLREVKEDLLQGVKERFDEEGIEIPYPTRTIAGDSLKVE